MNVIFYIAGSIALFSSVMAITNRNAIHALLYLIISLLSISVILYILGAPLIAALEVIVYAGAIMVLFIFVVMMLNIGTEKETERKWLSPGKWIIPSILAAILLVIFIVVLRIFKDDHTSPEIIGPKDVGIKLFTTYILLVEIAAVLLMTGIVGAYHLGKRTERVLHRFLVRPEPVNNGVSTEET